MILNGVVLRITVFIFVKILCVFNLRLDVMQCRTYEVSGEDRTHYSDIIVIAKQHCEPLHNVQVIL